MKKSDFGTDFVWGVSASAYQTEGAHIADGKGWSIWDEFTNKGKAARKENGNIACNFYEEYQNDISLMASLGIKNFRFSIAWTRIFPNGYGTINQKGIDFYNRVINYCLKSGVEPWITIYHWDLPFSLQQKGGWANREIINWFSEYASLLIRSFGDRVKKWMILNEPLVFTGAGHFMGAHAPGYKSLKYFLSSMHHAAMVQGMTPSILRTEFSDLEIGTTLSFSHLEPKIDSQKNLLATDRADAILNHLFLDPLLGLGYPIDRFKPIRKINDYMKSGDEKKLKAEYDFIGIQVYTREIIQHKWYIPFLKAKIVSANKRKVHHTEMNWEVYPESIYHIIKKVDAIPGVKKIIITENGAAFPDEMDEFGNINDLHRQQFYQSYLQQVLRAKKEGAKVNGYFIWSFTDNFEWAEGYHPRFGLVHIDFKNQKRTVKQSAKWYSSFLNE